jgi:putative protease
MTKRAKPEILAPAGSMEGLKAAIAAGCNAVYIGGNRFGARAFANNLDQDEMLEAIAYCHLHDVKLYMTVNTVLKDREIKEALFSYLRPYYEAGLDAVIVQDMGVLRFISRHFPKLAIHASTQMTLTMGKGKEFLEKYHVNRIVPARELTLRELCTMRRETSMELEVFVHGALCYCYSGQCLFSSMLGGRSGNRGRCAQPCRLPYHMAEQNRSEDAYLLSPKELCNLPYLAEMIEAGIDSFKIEGRMKRTEYTAFVTSMYRKYVDLYFALGKEKYRDYIKKNQKEWEEDLQNLSDLYNREGFTQGYLTGQAGDSAQRHPGQKGTMLASKRPKHGGVLVGTVQKVNPKEVIYKVQKTIHAQDVVEFRNHSLTPSYEYTLGEDVPAGTLVTARYKKGSEIRIGDQVYRTKNAVLLEKIVQDYLRTNEQVSVQGHCVAQKGQPLSLTVTLKGQTICCQGEICQKAKKRAIDESDIRKILQKTGNSPFYFEKLSIEAEENVFLPVGAIKQLRRDAFEQVRKQFLAQFWREDTVISEDINNREKDDQKGHAVSKESLKPQIATSVTTFEQAAAVCANPKVDRIYFETAVMTEKELSQAYHLAKEKQKEVWLAMPVIFRHAIWDRFEHKIQIIRENAYGQKDIPLIEDIWDGYLIRNTESFAFLTKYIPKEKLRIRLDHNMYVMNEEAQRFWKEQNVTLFSTSLEATKRELEAFQNYEPMEIPVYGKIPLMVSAQCIQANQKVCVCQDPKEWHKQIVFEDQKKRRFVCVNYCRYCYNIIYQDIPLYLEEIADQSTTIAGSIRYSFTTESASLVERILQGNMPCKTQRGHFDLGIE